jgi:predicted metalloendopeptidase
MIRYNQLLEEAQGLASDLQLILRHLSAESTQFPDKAYFQHLFNDLNIKTIYIEHALSVLSVNENPAVIARPLKTAKKLKWWAIGLLDENKTLIKRVVTQYRTKTEAKLYARSGLQMHSMGKQIEYALVEGPYETMNEAQTAPLLFPEETV